MGNLCKDQRESLITETLELLRKREVPEDEIGSLLKEVEQGFKEKNKDRLVEEYSQWSQEQKQVYIDRGMPEIQANLINDKQQEVIDRALTMQFKQDEISFLWVPSQHLISIPSLVQMVIYKNKRGYTHLDPREITNTAQVPNELWYAMFAVENGKRMLGESPRDAEKEIKNQKRLPNTAREVTVIGIQTNTLSDHNIDAPGSRYESDGVPDLYRDGDGPKLNADDPDNGVDEWGAASCGSR
jgi:hypothetical protein